jgi:hypothetical protein
VIIKVDIAKAYPTTPRARILELLVEKAPKLVRHFLAVYDLPSSREYAGLETLWNEEGINTGDALGPFLAQLVYSDNVIGTEIINYFLEAWGHRLNCTQKHRGRCSGQRDDAQALVSNGQRKSGTHH